MPTLDEFSAKIESADKDRMLLELEVQRLRQLHDRLIASQPKPEPVETKPKAAPPPSEKVTVTIKSILLPNPALNPYAQASKPNLEQLTHRVIHKAHETPIACVATHPKRKVYATAGDDAVWHLWNAENQELLISGRGHSAWITSCAFHPRGAHLATASADGTARVWDFLSSKCALILKGHLDVVWSCDFHSGGRVLATSGSDSTIRLYDLQGGQELSILRGHDRDINCVRRCLFSNTKVTGGADHLVGLWDAREGAMVNRGIGHSGTVFGVAPTLSGSSIASVDSTGEIKLWDIREMRPIFETSYASTLYSCGADVTGTYIFVASDDGKAQVFIRDEAKTSWTLSTFDQACETIAVNADGDMIVCGSGDGSVAVCTNQ
jgi:WD40 repeat protein